MASKASTNDEFVVDGSFDFSQGVDSSKVTTLASALNPNGLPRNALAWLNNATLRDCGITQRTGWQPLVKLLDFGYWQGGYIYEPDAGYPYLVCQISGILYSVLLQPPYTVTDLTGGNATFQNPSDPAQAEMAFFCQGESFLVIQAGDYFNPGAVIPGVTDLSGRTLPLFWDGTTLRRSIGITTPAPAGMLPGINELPAAMMMDYYGTRFWYAQARSFSAGDMAGGPSGTAPWRYRDSILSVTENPLCFAGDGFSVPTNAGNIRAIKHSAQLNQALGQGQLYVGTRKAWFQMTVPTTRTDWINADSSNQPELTIVDQPQGPVGDRSVVPTNGDLYYQSFAPSIRSLIRAQNYMNTPGNTAISQNEQRALQVNDRALMRFSSGIFFDSRILNLVLPQLAQDGVNIIHKAILPLDFDNVSNYQNILAAIWEGAWDGNDWLQLFEGDFGGLPRAFGAMISAVDGSINVWELTTDNRRENGDNRVTWSAESPAYNWAASTSGSMEFQLKQLNGGEVWIDKVAGTVDMDVYYRVDAEPCWRRWFHCSFCAERCEDTNPSYDGLSLRTIPRGVCFPDSVSRAASRTVRRYAGPATDHRLPVSGQDHAQRLVPDSWSPAARAAEDEATVSRSLLPRPG